MFRKRERFERSDVPGPNPLRPVISIIVIAVAFFSCYVLWTSLWHKANQMNALNDGDLDDALYDQLSTHDPTEGWIRSDDDFSNVVIFTVDDINAEVPHLLKAQLLVRDMTATTATVVNLPINTKMLADESNVMLEAYYEYAGPGKSIAPLTDAANVHVSHVIIATDKLFEQLERLEGPTLHALMSSSTNDLATIASDYRTGELVALADYLRTVGFENIKTIDAPYSEDTFGDGTPVAVIDRQQLCRDLGIFVSPFEDEAVEESQPEGEAPEEGSGEGSEG